VSLLLVLALAASDDDLSRARAMYEQMHYDSALKALARAITRPGLTSSDRAQIYLYTGLCRHQTGDEAGAFAMFKEALTIDATIELPDAVSPKTRREFEKARAEIPRPAPVEEPRPAPPPLAPAAPPIAIVAPPAPPPPPREKIWWPTIGSSVLAAVTGGTGIYLGTRAVSLSNAAGLEAFASDGMRLSDSAQHAALAANVLYAIAGAALAFAVIAALLF
jgi:hypothetical protein